MSQKNEFAVVTGASSGIGHATARALATRGFHVLAGVRRESDAEQLAGKNLEPVILDVTDAAQIAALADRVTGDAEGRPFGRWSTTPASRSTRRSKRSRWRSGAASSR